jgi:hypothetical protein
LETLIITASKETNNGGEKERKKEKLFYDSGVN